MFVAKRGRRLEKLIVNTPGLFISTVVVFAYTHVREIKLLGR